jgi:hypothetical protein
VFEECQFAKSRRRKRLIQSIIVVLALVISLADLHFRHSPHSVSAGEALTARPRYPGGRDFSAPSLRGQSLYSPPRTHARVFVPAAYSIVSDSLSRNPGVASSPALAFSFNPAYPGLAGQKAIFAAPITLARNAENNSTQPLPAVLSSAASDASLAKTQSSVGPIRALPAAVAQGQAPLPVGYQKRVQIALTGATAAYSLDPLTAEATASNGIIEITGKAPGTTNVVIVTQAGVQTLTVVVPVPPPSYPPGFEPPERTLAGESGTYEFRYNSDPGQITNSLDMRRSQGESFDRVQIVNANLFSAGSSASNVGFPFLSYEISRPGHDYTFIDQMVSNSPLTLDGYLVRGMHVREGDWQFHAGFSSIATFQGLFLTTDREYVAGASRTFRLDDSSSVQANLFYFRNPDNQQLVSSNGVAGTVVYRYRLKDRVNLLTEWGFNSGVAFAARGSYDDEKNHLSGSLRLSSPDFAGLALNNQHGRFASLDSTRKFNERLYGSLDFNQSDFNLPQLRQGTTSSSLLLNYRLTRHVSLTGGGAFSSFSSQVPPAPGVHTFNAPAAIDFSTRHFGSGFQYQRTTTFDGSGGNDYSVNARASAGKFHGNAFFRHDVQVPTLAAIFSQVPGLQDALFRAGITASTPDQLAQLLNNTALLETLGFTNLLTVNLAPARNDSGASLTWAATGARRQQVDLSYFNSSTELLQGKLNLTTATVSYAQKLTTNDNIVGSAALVRSVDNGSKDTHPLFSVSLQHRFYSVPGFLMPGRHGMIGGHIFRDDESDGVFTGKQEPLVGVEVRLDGERVTHTDSYGFYSFRHVPYGVHKIEPKIASSDPFFYTTDFPATTDINNTVDFGINFAKGQIFGFLLNDAGAPVPGITVQLDGKTLTRTTQTGGNGKFTFPGIPAGNYTVATAPDSYPSGYSLQALAPQSVTVDPGKPAGVKFTVKAIRSLGGKVMTYDKSAAQTVPLAGVTVRLKELSLETHTGTNGAYLFRNLPAGTFTVVVEFEGRESTQVVTVPPEPASIRDIDLNVSSK